MEVCEVLQWASVKILAIYKGRPTEKDESRGANDDDDDDDDDNDDLHVPNPKIRRVYRPDD
jgi:hypothetical protein